MNIYDINITDEDDALLQVFKHSSIHHAGFIGEDRVYALSHDEVFAIHNLNDSEDAETKSSVEFGDLRPVLGCDYVVQVLADQWGTFVAAGKTRLGSSISSLLCMMIRPPSTHSFSLPLHLQQASFCRTYQALRLMLAFERRHFSVIIWAICY